MARLESLGKYQLIKRVAVGGMSEIFLASQGGLHDFERAVIVKCIREDLDTEREVLDMFLDEARIAACLKHPNIVHLYDVGRDQGLPYLAMEYIFGRDLMQIGERARALGRELPIQFIVKLICDALAGLHYAHAVAEYEDRPLSVIHRDISPQNILVSFDGITKVVDFGIAKAEARLSKTQAGILKGKYAYMSPEQVRGRPLDHRSDQFSLAVVFYEVLTGTRLFQRETDYSTMEAVDECEVPPIKILRKDVPRRVVKVLRKAMRRKPKKRFKTTKDMERALHKLLKGSSVEQTEFVSKYMRTLFNNELVARDRAIRDATDDEREIILSTGFEMFDGGTTNISAAPPPPTASRRYEEILAERQGEKTALGARTLDAQRSESGVEIVTEDHIITDRGGDEDSPRQRARTRGPGRNNLQSTSINRQVTDVQDAIPAGGWMSDWRVMVLVFAAVMVLVLFLMSTFSDQDPVAVDGPEPDPTIMQPGQAEKHIARPGIDGFLSISVRPTVQVLIDGKVLGNGTYHKVPLEKGKHTLMLKEGAKKKVLTVYITANREKALVPDDWQ